MRAKRSFPAPVAVAVLVVTAMVLAACGSGTTADAPQREAAGTGSAYNKFPGWDGNPKNTINWDYAQDNHYQIHCKRATVPTGGPKEFRVRQRTNMPLNDSELGVEGFSANADPAYWPATYAARLGQDSAGIRALKISANQDGIRNWKDETTAVDVNTGLTYFPSVDALKDSTVTPGYVCAPYDADNPDPGLPWENQYVGVTPDAYVESNGAWSFAGAKLGYEGSVYHDPFRIQDADNSAMCLDSKFYGSNETRIVTVQDCIVAEDRNAEYQKFVARADGSIRTKGNLNFCLTERIAQPGDRAGVNPCGSPLGGNQKWGLLTDGRIVGNTNDTSRCLTAEYSKEEASFFTKDCSTTGLEVNRWRITSDGTNVSAGCMAQTDTQFACQVTKLASGDERRVGLVGAYHWTLPVRLTVNNDTTSMMVISSAPSSGGSSGTFSVAPPGEGTENLVPNDGKGNVPISGKVLSSISTGDIGFLRTFDLDSPKLSKNQMKNADQTLPDVAELKVVKDKPFWMKLRVIVMDKTALGVAADDCAAGNPVPTGFSSEKYAEKCGSLTVVIYPVDGDGGRPSPSPSGVYSASTATSYNKIHFEVSERTGPAITGKICLEPNQTKVDNEGKSARSLGIDGFMDLRLGLISNCTISPNFAKDAVLDTNTPHK